ncbi:MAG: AbgT family transporter, partial [Planctomycetia bacterium]|nr:AbgT family transporter [Planctomycetia bacterium]
MAHENRNARSNPTQRLLDVVEWLGNKLPDPAFLFLFALLITWGVSAYLAPIEFTELNPSTKQPIRVVSQVTSSSLVNFLANMVKTFVEFPPLGMVLVSMLGVGVAEHTGFIPAALKSLLRLTPRKLLTPMLLFVGLLSHSVGDPGFVLVIPLGAVMYAAAWRHPLLGITTAFASVGGGFSANFLPSGLDPLLQGFTQSSAQIIDPQIVINQGQRPLTS